jgi:hypothetical protein
LVCTYQFVFDLLIDAARDVDVSGTRNSLKARCNVDAIAKDAIRFDNYVAEMNAGAARDVVGIRRGAISGNMKVSFQAARSIG